MAGNLFRSEFPVPAAVSEIGNISFILNLSEHIHWAGVSLGYSHSYLDSEAEQHRQEEERTRKVGRLREI